MKQAGFTLIESILTIVALAIIGTSFILWYQQASIKPVPKTTAKSASSSTQTTACPMQLPQPSIDKNQNPLITTIPNPKNSWIIRQSRPSADSTVNFYLDAANQTTHQCYRLGMVFGPGAGQPAIFTPDGQTIIFAYDNPNQVSNRLQIRFYSLAQNKLIKTITRADLNKFLPNPVTDEAAYELVFYNLQLSPDGQYLTWNLGYPFEHIEEGDILVYDLQSNKFVNLNQPKGLIKQWQGDKTLAIDKSVPTQPYTTATLTVP